MKGNNFNFQNDLKIIYWFVSSVPSISMILHETCELLCTTTHTQCNSNLHPNNCGFFQNISMLSHKTQTSSRRHFLGLNLWFLVGLNRLACLGSTFMMFIKQSPLSSPKYPIIFCPIHNICLLMYLFFAFFFTFHTSTLVKSVLPLAQILRKVCILLIHAEAY